MLATAFNYMVKNKNTIANKRRSLTMEDVAKRNAENRADANNECRTRMINKSFNYCSCLVSMKSIGDWISKWHMECLSPS